MSENCGAMGAIAARALTVVAALGFMAMTASAQPAPVPKTGQTPSAPGPNPNTTSMAGSDANLQKGVAWPDPRFTDNGNGTVTDNLTGLVWLQNANAFGLKTFSTALSDCATLNSGEQGLSDGSVEGDWRLPNFRELESLIAFSAMNPALPAGHPFSNVQNLTYWSSTVFPNDFTNLLELDFASGLAGIVSGQFNSTRYVWPVRGGDGVHPAPVPKTGQTLTQPPTGPGDVRPYGETDGKLQKGVAWPDPRFTDNNNGTVKDNLTGLVWLQNANAFGLKTFSTALSDCAAVASGVTAGLTDGSAAGDWRLPNAKELESLIDWSMKQPALPSDHPFSNVQTGNGYWSSTAYPNDLTNLYVIHMGDGLLRIASYSGTSLVWPVRGGDARPTGVVLMIR